MLLVQTAVEGKLTRYEVRLNPEDTPSREAFTKRIRETLTEDVYEVPTWMNGNSTNPYLVELFAVLTESPRWNYTTTEDNPVFNESFRVDRAPINDDAWGAHLNDALGIILRFMDWDPNHVASICHQLEELRLQLGLSLEDVTLLCMTEMFASNTVDRSTATEWIAYRKSCLSLGIEPTTGNLMEFFEICNQLSLYVALPEEEKLLGAGLVNKGFDSTEVYAWMMTHEGKCILREMNAAAFLKDHDFDMYRAAHTYQTVPWEILEELYQHDFFVPF